MCKQATPNNPPTMKANSSNDQQANNNDVDLPHSSTKTQETDMFTCLIPKNPTLHQPPTIQPQKPNNIHLSLVVQESLSIAKIALPMILTGLLLYSRSMISMLFLGRLGDLALAGGSLAVGFANITGYSILSGLAMGMEPICGQAFGAKKYKILGLSLQRTLLLLFFASFPISIMWLNMKKILLLCGQDKAIATRAQEYLFYSLPDLFAQALLHPLRIYLRTQSITMPLTFCAAISVLLHVPINYLLVSKLSLGLKGVALSGVWTNINLVLLLLVYILFSGVYKRTWGGLSIECFKGWKPLLNLAIPSCISVCLEWWWYEIMILLCGLLLNPKATVASMGILIQTTALIYIFPSSLSFSVSTRVSNEIGARRPEKAKFAAVVGLSGSFILGFSALFFVVSIRNIWARMFTQDKEIIALTSLVLPIIGLCELGNCPQTTGCGVLRGTARPKVGANINLGCFYLVGMPVAVGLAFYYKLDFEGLWFGLLAAQASCMVTMMIVLLRTDWEMEARRAQELTGDYAVVDQNQEVNENDQSNILAENKGKGESLC
ncbi:protein DETOXIFICATION 49-like [Primulina eburnea]|uniref:protein DETOXIFICATION 49-like n=1 Tax=Primulina eburnea TaxID=1245227 RepID=UPI003C6BE8A6